MKLLGTLSVLMAFGLSRQALGQPNPFELTRAALQRYRSLEVTLMIKEGRNPARTMRLVLAKPGMARVEMPDRLITSDGDSILIRPMAGGTATTQPYSDAFLLAAFDRDDLRLWALFFAPKSLDSYSVKASNSVLQDNRLLASYTLDDPKRPGVAYAVLIDPTTHLPTEISVSRPDSIELTRISVRNVKVDQEVGLSAFQAAGQTATQSSNSAKREISLQWDELKQRPTVILPLQTSFTLHGKFPSELSGLFGSAATISLYADGVLSAQVETESEWKLSWVPKDSGVRSYELRVEARLGQRKVSMGTVEASIRPDLPWAVVSGAVEEDGATLLQGDFKAFEAAEKLTLAADGSPLKSHFQNGKLRVWGDRFAPGRVNLQGKLVTKDGASFELQPASVDIAPWVTVGGWPAETITVGREQLDTGISLVMQTVKGTASGSCVVTVNGIEVLRDQVDDGRVQLAMYNLFDGRNDVRVELHSAGKVYFAPVHTLAASLTVEVQRIRVSDVLRMFARDSLQRAVYFYARVLGAPIERSTLPPGLTDTLEVGPRSWTATAEAMKRTISTEELRVPLTTDAAYNDRAKATGSTFRATAEALSHCINQLVVAHGDAGYLKKRIAVGVSVHGAVGQMREALEDSFASSREGKKRVFAVGEFFIAYPCRSGEFLQNEVRLLRGIQDLDVSHGELLLCLQLIEDIAGARNDMQRVTALKRAIEGKRDFRLRAELAQATFYFSEICRIRRQMKDVAEKIERLEVALALATSQEERQEIAKQIARLRTELVDLESGARKLRSEAWRLIEGAAASAGSDLSGAYDAAVREDRW